MSTSTRLASLTLAVVTLGGCAAVGPDYVAPPPPAVAAYVAPGETAPARIAVGERLAADWWTLFRSPQIDAVVRQAVSDNFTLQAARERLGQARETVLAQNGPLQGDFTASAVRQHINLAGFGVGNFGGLGIENPTVNLYSIGASARYDFDIFGARRREGETRQARASVAAAELDAAYLSLTGQVVTQALAIATLNAQIAAVEDVAAQDRAIIDMADKALRGGSGTRLDVVTAQAQLAADNALLPTLRQQRAIARHALTVLVGKTPSAWTPPDFDLAAITLPGSAPVAIPSELARHRPDIRAAEARLHAATAQVGVAEARLYPALTLSGSLTQSALKPESIFSSDFSGWSVGPLGISLPLLGRGELKAQSRSVSAAARAARADYQPAVTQAFGQVADVLQALQNDQVAVAAQGEALAIAAESLRLNRLRYQGGKAGLLPVIDAQRAYQRARVAQVRAQSQLYLDTAQLYLVTGGGWTASQPVGPEAASTKG